MVEAGGGGIFTGIENTRLIDFSIRQKRRTRQNCVELERNWNAGFSVLLPILWKFFWNEERSQTGLLMEGLRL
jgi:hypothetical protein